MAIVIHFLEGEGATGEPAPETAPGRVEGAEVVELSRAAARRGVLVDQPCGGKATCGLCRVRIVRGDAPPDAADRRVLGELVEEGWRLGCRLRLSGPTVVEIPPAEGLMAEKGFGGDDLPGEGFVPVFRRSRVGVPAAGEVAAGSLAEEAAAAAGIPPEALAAASPEPLRRLLGLLADGREASLLLEEDRLVRVDAPEAVEAEWGVAVDVGTTTLAAALVRLDDGSVGASASTVNPQVRHGADVVSRIERAAGDPAGLRELHEELVHTLDGLLRECGRRAGVDRRAIRGVSFAGNATMTHTLLGIDPATLGRAPYVGAWRGAWRGAARDLGLDLPAECRAYVVPGIRSHVGGDTVAALLALGLDGVAAPALMVDLGTNSEVVLATGEGLLCASTAAGPAFEGASIRNGLRAVPGAIDRVTIGPGGGVEVHVLGEREPAGICGSGLVDAVAALLDAGIVEPSGRMRTRDEVADAGSGDLAARIEEGKGGDRVFRLAGEAGGGVVLGAGDVRELQLVKGSIAGGIRVLLEEAGIRPEEVEEVLVSGAFGNYVRRESARAIGLVPSLAASGELRFVGDAAAAGARLLLVDREARRRGEELHRSARVLDLAGREDFRRAFVESMAFPEPGGGRR